MPVDFLTPAQREQDGRYPDTLSTEELARYFHLYDDDLDWIAGKRRDRSRLGYALQSTTARFLGAVRDDPTAVPGAVLHVLASGAGVTPPNSGIGTAASLFRQAPSSSDWVAGFARCAGAAPTWITAKRPLACTSRGQPSK